MECRSFGTPDENNGYNTGCPERFVLFGQFFLPKNIKTALYQKRTLCKRDRAKPYPCCQNIKAALYQKRTLCNRDRAKPYPCYQKIKTALYQKRGLDFGGYDI